MAPPTPGSRLPLPAPASSQLRVIGSGSHRVVALPRVGRGAPWLRGSPRDEDSAVRWLEYRRAQHGSTLKQKIASDIKIGQLATAVRSQARERVEKSSVMLSRVALMWARTATGDMGCGWLLQVALPGVGGAWVGSVGVAGLLSLAQDAWLLSAWDLGSFAHGIFLKSSLLVSA